MRCVIFDRGRQQSGVSIMNFGGPKCVCNRWNRAFVYFCDAFVKLFCGRFDRVNVNFVHIVFSRSRAFLFR